MVYKPGIERRNRWDAIEVFESEIPDAEDLQNFYITSKHKPTELIFLRDPASSVLVGPFQVPKIEQEQDSSNSYQFGVSPIQSQIPNFFQLMTKSVHSALKIPLNANNLDAITTTLVDSKREFVGQAVHEAVDGNVGTVWQQIGIYLQSAGIQVCQIARVRTERGRAGQA